MRVETNERLAHRNRQIAQYLFFATFGILILGLVVINQQASTISQQSPMLHKGPAHSILCPDASSTLPLHLQANCLRK